MSSSSKAGARLARVSAQLGAGARLAVRPLEEGDYDKGYFELLTQLSTTPKPSREAFEATLRYQRAAGGTYNPLVVEDLEAGVVLAAATLLVEAKFLRGCSFVGHVEDVVVSKAARGRKLGAMVMDALVRLARGRGCYKVILDCAKHNVGFYEKLGFKDHAHEMALYF